MSKRRPKTEAVRPRVLTPTLLAAGKAAYPLPHRRRDAPRVPATVSDCQRRDLGSRARPCPYVSCKHHLALDVNRATGAIILNAPLASRRRASDGRVPELDLAAMPATCALRAAAAGGMTLTEVGSVLGLTRERVRQIEGRAIAAAKAVRLPLYEDLAPDDDPRDPDPTRDAPGDLSGLGHGLRHVRSGTHIPIGWR